MGYTTRFSGTLSFTKEVTVRQLVKLKSFFGEDCREHPEWSPDKYTAYIDLRITEDLEGIEWDDETEKNSGMVDAVNIIIREMRKEWPDFGLTGSFIAQGEDLDDRWALVIGEDGFAHEEKLVVAGKKVECPHCHRKFIVEEAKVD